MTSRRVLLVLLVSFASSLSSGPVAAWPHSPSQNVAVCTAGGIQDAISAVSDDAGGVIVVWTDFRSGNSYDLYAQRVSATGIPLWTTNGVVVSNAGGYQSNPRIAPDGSGGVLVAWEDGRNGNVDIYAQRLDGNGVAVWAANGVAVTTNTAAQANPVIAHASNGGAFVMWEDDRNLGTTGRDIYGQIVQGGFGIADIAVCTAAGTQQGLTLTTESVGSYALVAWQDGRTDAGDIYCQRVQANGGTVFLSNGLAFCTNAGTQLAPSIAPDATGGCFIAWTDGRVAASDIYAQRVTGGGVVQWANNGVAVCSSAGAATTPRVVSDGVGGVFVAFLDTRLSNTAHVFAQHVADNGAMQWVADGITVCSAANAQSQLAAAPDGFGGLFLSWTDPRTFGSVADIYGQHLDASGTAQWQANGMAFTTAPATQLTSSVVADGARGAIAAWLDARTSQVGDVYAQKIDRWGILGGEPHVADVADVPNDQGGRVKVSWDASPLDTDILFENIASYVVFRSAPPLAAAAARSAGRFTASPDEALREGMILAVPSGAQDYYWEVVGTVTPYHLPTYSFIAPTTGDSIPGSNPLSAFMVMAQAYTPTTQWWFSNPDSGYSVDDLAPVAPAPFTGEFQPQLTRLHWNPNTETDLAGYRLYRGTTPSFPADAAHLIAALPDTGYQDPAGVTYYYQLTAIDTHGNESPVAFLLPQGTLGVEGPATAAFFAAPQPNPARRDVALRFGLPAAGHVTLVVHDAAGRRVRLIADEAFPPGEHTLRWDGLDDAGHAVAPGLYFARLSTPDLKSMRKIARVE